MEVVIESRDKRHAFLVARNSFIDGVFSWLTRRAWKEGARASYRKLLLSPVVRGTVSTDKTRSNGIKKPLRARDCSRLTVDHPFLPSVQSTPHLRPLQIGQITVTASTTTVITLLHGVSSRSRYQRVVSRVKVRGSKFFHSRCFQSFQESLNF